MVLTKEVFKDKIRQPEYLIRLVAENNAEQVLYNLQRNGDLAVTKEKWTVVDVANQLLGFWRQGHEAKVLNAIKGIKWNEGNKTTAHLSPYMASLLGDDGGFYTVAGSRTKWEKFGDYATEILGTILGTSKPPVNVTNVPAKPDYLPYVFAGALALLGLGVFWFLIKDVK